MADAGELDTLLYLLKSALPRLDALAHILYAATCAQLQDHGNPVARCGGKVFSQNDEDGITLEILRRIGKRDGVFAEFGVGNGTENNTLALAAAGWSGFWVGWEPLAFDCNPGKVAEPNFTYRKEWVKRSNIQELYSKGLQSIGREVCDLISLDLDGNDFYLVEELIGSGVRPGVFIVEYNAKFRPPIKFKIAYDEHHQWKGDDYFGASLAEFYELFLGHGYFLACCNTIGANAFFVRNEFREAFLDVPKTLEELYASPKYYLYGLDTSGHKMSMKTVETIFARLNAKAEMVHGERQGR